MVRAERTSGRQVKSKWGQRGKSFGRNDEYNRYIGDMLREYRMSRGMSVNDVAEAMGVHACCYSRYENGHTSMTLYALTVLAHVFDIPPDELMYILTNELWEIKERREHDDSSDN